MSEVLSDELNTIPPHSGWLPSFLRKVKEHGEENGFVEAFHHALQGANISVNIDGDVDRLKEHTGGILFVGDHKTRWEFIAIADVLSQIERSELLNIAKFYVQRQVYMMLGHKAANEHVIPVYPRILARDRLDIFNYEFSSRFLFRKHLLSFAESLEANAHSLAKASQALVKSSAVNIHPTGCVEDATIHEWRSGIGRIIQQIPDENKGDVLLAPYSVDNFSQARLLGAIATHGFGPFGRPQSMEVKLGSLQTTLDLVEELPHEEREDPEAITERLRTHFLKDFANQ